MTVSHNLFLAMYAQTLLQRGHVIAREVGVPGGRIDIVRLNDRDEWVELYEIKIHWAVSGIRQLVRYAEQVPGRPRLTLVVPPALATDDLYERAAESRVRVREFDVRNGVQRSLFPAVGRNVYLPYIHPASAAAMAERWRAEKTGVDA